MGYMDEYKFWLEDSYFDADTKAELKAVEETDYGQGLLRGYD